MQNGIEAILSKHELVPVVTINTLEEVDEIATKLQSQHISCIEITLRTAVAWEAIALFKERYGSTFDVGVGTIVNSENVAKAVEVGVDFMVSPGCTDTLASEMEKSGIAFLPGASTPSEIIQAMEHGWRYLKFFPANLFGGLKALKTYGALFPETYFCPTGGVSEDNYPEYLALSNVVCVGGSWLTK